MEKENGFGVEEDGIYVFVTERWSFRGRSHLKRSKKTGDEDLRWAEIRLISKSVLRRVKIFRSHRWRGDFVLIRVICWKSSDVIEYHITFLISIWHDSIIPMSKICRVWTRKSVKNYLKLLEIFFLGLDHWKDQTVTFPHTLSMRRLDIFLDNLLPPSSTQPSPKEALNFFNFLQLCRVLRRIAEGSEIWYIIEIVDQLMLFDGVTRCAAYASSTRCRWKWWARRFLAKYANLFPSTSYRQQSMKYSILTLVRREWDEQEN